MTSRRTFTSLNPTSKRYEMTPATLKAIRMDMGLNMVNFAKLLEGATTHKNITRNRYRSWERPKANEDQWPFIPRHIAEAAGNLYNSFNEFVVELTRLGLEGQPLLLIHQNDMFSEASLPLPEGITVDNYNQAVGKAWGRVLDFGKTPELLYFSTDTSPEEVAPDRGASRNPRTPRNPQSGPDSPLPHPREIQKQPSSTVGSLPYGLSNQGSALIPPVKGAGTPWEKPLPTMLREHGSDLEPTSKTPGQTLFPPFPAFGTTPETCETEPLAPAPEPAPEAPATPGPPPGKNFPKVPKSSEN